MRHAATLQDASLLLLRVVIGAVFLYAGYGKLFLWTSPPEGMSASMVLFMKFLSIVEPLGGLALIAGFLTRWASAGLAIIMVGAAVFLRMMNTNWFTGQTGSGIDYVLLLLAGCVVLIAFGAGRWAVDAVWKKIGGRPKSRYLLFHIPIRLEKKVHFVDNGRFRKGYEKVVVRERNMSAGERRYWDAEVLAR